MSGLEEDVLRHALTTAREHGFRRVKLSSEGERFSAVLGEVEVYEDEHDDFDGETVFEPEALGPRDIEITAPVVGYFQAGKVPLETGRKVETGETVGEIVALGIPNDVVTIDEGEIVEVLVSPGEPVEYGQVLAKVRTT